MLLLYFMASDRYCTRLIEHVNRRLKIFKIISERYRNRRRLYGLRCNLLSAILRREASPLG